jgi:KaiC/GvpD/RAD55 family RecA-like ATPase
MEGIEQKVIGFLVHSGTKSLKKYLRETSKITWSPKAKEAYDLCKAYTSMDGVDFSCAEFVSNEHSDTEYILSLLDDGSVFIESFASRNIEKLIKQQDNKNIKGKLEDLKGKSPDEVLAGIKSIKSSKPVKPLNLDEVRSQRLIDREYEKIAPSTGYKGLDAIIKGFVPGRTITMTGETNVGKTQISCNFAYNVAKQGKKVLYFSLEPDITVIEYLASIWSSKRFDSVTDKDLHPPKGIEIDVYTKEHVDSLEDMVTIVENSERYDLIVIDHFGYFTTTGNNKTQTESNAMKVMASLSKQNKCCVLIVVHPRKSSPGKKQKSLSIQDISGSAAFSQDATDVLIVVRKKDEDDPMDIKYTNYGLVAVHKTKAGGNGFAPIKFIEGSAKIMELDDAGAEESKLF